jgi:cytochrome c5
VLIAIALVLVGISRMVDSGPKGARDTDDPLMQASAEERIRPFGQVAVAGEDNAGKEIVASACGRRGGAGGDRPGQPMDGKTVFESACRACHGTGIAGAPKVGDKAAWAPRIAQGVPTLEKHALGGFQAAKACMPAKGGRADLPDDAVRAAVEYMVSQAARPPPVRLAIEPPVTDRSDNSPTPTPARPRDPRSCVRTRRIR